MLYSTTRLDNMELPNCAKLGQRGTVIMRLRDDLCQTCGRSVCVTECTRTVKDKSELIARKCCYHTSACDKVILDNRRPFRASRARSRFINVCATVCLLLLLGSHPQPSTAAPRRLTVRNMENGSKRPDTRQTEEPEYLRNPCGYPEDMTYDPYLPKLASNVAKYANLINDESSKYKNKLSMDVHSVDDFSNLLEQWKSYNWFKSLGWFREEMLPEDKVIGTPVTEEYLENLMNKLKDKEQENILLPLMYKGVKTFSAAFHKMSNNGMFDRHSKLFDIKQNITHTATELNVLMCQFYNFMAARGLTILPIDESDLPDYTKYQEDILIVFRDLLNYLEYISQVFQKISTNME